MRINKMLLRFRVSLFNVNFFDYAEWSDSGRRNRGSCRTDLNWWLPLVPAFVGSHARQ